MRLIDADALKEQAYTSWECKSQPCAVVDVQDIDNAPTVDAVQVVRCKDCKMRRGHMDGYTECGKHDVISIWHPDDFYCADGERRDNA